MSSKSYTTDCVVTFVIGFFLQMQNLFFVVKQKQNYVAAQAVNGAAHDRGVVQLLKYRHELHMFQLTGCLRKINTKPPQLRFF